ncbi:DUF4382 domain-containing protein [Chloroflexota bacterium]
MFKSKLYLITMILVILALATGACIQPTPPVVPEGNGTISVYVTDDPADGEVTGIVVTLSEVQVHMVLFEQEQSATDNQLQDDGGKWVTIDTGDDATFDLLQIEGVEQFLGKSEVEAAKYTQVRLIIDKVQVSLGSGELTDTILPSGELKLVRPFDVMAGEAIALIIDFEADKMVTVTRAGNITVKPVVKLIIRKEKLANQGEGQETTKSIVLEDMEWVLASYGDPDNLTMTLEDTEITVVFNSTEGRISGSAGCNNYFAGYEINQNELTFTSPVGSTRIACPGAVMDQEVEYLEILQNIESFDIKGDQLRIVSGDKVLLFEGK